MAGFQFYPEVTLLVGFKGVNHATILLDRKGHLGEGLGVRRALPGGPTLHRPD